MQQMQRGEEEADRNGGGGSKSNHALRSSAKIGRIKKRVLRLTNAAAADALW